MENEDRIRNAIESHYDIGHVVQCKHHPVGFINKTFKVETKNGQYALTEFLHKSTHEVAARAEVILKLRGLPVASPVALLSGEHTMELDGQPIWICPWLEGESLVRRSTNRTPQMSLEQHHEIILYFRVLHEQLNQIANQIKDLNVFALTEILDIDTDAMQTIGQLVIECRDSYSNIEIAPDNDSDLIHGDFEKQNLLFEEDTLVGILDFDALRIGNLPYEWAHLAFDHACYDINPSPDNLDLYVEACPLSGTKADVRRQFLALIARYCENDIRGFAWISQNKKIELSSIVDRYRAALTFAKHSLQ